MPALCAAALAMPPAPAAHPIQQRAPRPPLGWNSFDSYGVYLPEDAAMANLEAMAKKLKPSGYEYFVIDNGWFGEYKLHPGTRYAAEKHASDVNINQYGLLEPSKTYFPHGMKPIIDRAHELGLKFGLHLMRGIPRKAVQQNLPIQGTRYHARDVADTASICVWCPYNYGVNMDKPGAQAFYDSLINQLAGWGVDFVKADDLVPYPKEIIGLANAIEQAKRPMVFSLSPGANAPLENLTYYRRANMLRITADVWDRRKDIEKGFEAWKRFSGTACDGFWPDLDMIPFGRLQLMSPKEMAAKGDARLAGYGYKRSCELTKDQQYTFITMRALAASPLFMGGDLPSLDDFSLSLITNKEMLRCDQNGVMGMNVYEIDGIEIYVTPERDHPGQGWAGVFNRTEAARKVTLGKKEFGFRSAHPFRLRSVWTPGELALGEQPHSFDIAVDGVLFYRFEESRA